jgi:hypothetical protein
MAEIADLTTLDAGNTGRFPEGQSIPSLNDGARALEGIIARAHKDRSGYTASSGTGAAYQILTLSAYPAHAAGMVFQWRASVASLAGPTLQVNSLVAKPLARQGGGGIRAGDISANQQVLAAYNTALDVYECIGIGDGAPSAPSYTVALLPTGAVGRLAFATNGRKNGQAAAAGTGVLVVHDGSAWCAVDTMAVVQA